MHSSILNCKTRIAVATLALVCAAAAAQEKADEQNDEDDTIEEIVVVAGERSGDPVDVEALYEEMMRNRLMLEQEQLRILQEDTAWRTSGTSDVEKPSRISWGYDPAEELRMRRDTQLADVQFITTRPATLFRVDF